MSVDRFLFKYFVVIKFSYSIKHSIWLLGILRKFSIAYVKSYLN